MNFDHENLPEHEVTTSDFFWGTCRLSSNTQSKLDGSFQLSNYPPKKKTQKMEVVSSKTFVSINQQLPT